MDEPVGLLVVDDHPVFREGFAALLANIDGVDVLGTASSGVEALAQVAALKASGSGPRVVVMDVQMPEMDGLEATRRLAAEHPEVGVVVLTMSEEDSTVFEAVRAGARGYLLKGAEPDEVVRAITTVAAGGVVFGAALAARVAAFFSRPQEQAGSPFPMLTAREHEVLDLVAAGLSNAQIAGRLFLSQKTVRNHVHAVLSKLQAADRAEAIVRGRDAGLGR
ncbi:MAG TPA: response regulator transcription factor [Marmoricola sp.]|nr:response regulator transcription factor [Marmoricola sp.]